MRDEVDHDAMPCRLCGREVPDGRCLSVEVQRLRVPDDPFDVDTVGGDFCSQDHAAQWLAQPLPEPEPAMPYVPTRRERLEDVQLVAALAGIGVFAVIGFVGTGWWLLSLIWGS